MKDKKYLIALSAFNYFGPARLKLLLSYFGSARGIWKAGIKELVEVGLPMGKMNEFQKFRERFDIDSYLRNLEELKIDTVSIFDKEYPSNLKDLEGVPTLLYIRGKLKAKDLNSVAIVGSRKMTLYGKKVTEKFSSDLSKKGIPVISGLARGIDTAAHRASLLSKGRTIAVLGSGLDNIYPPENRSLAEEIVQKGGALISEYPLGTPPLPYNFVARNRIISGISKVVVVIEGAEKSGTLITASHAAEQGKTVLAVPGEIYAPLSAAPLFLIKNGAKIAASTQDIIDELDI